MRERLLKKSKVMLFLVLSFISLEVFAFAENYPKTLKASIDGNTSPLGKYHVHNFQKKEMRGTVSDATGPLPGVTVSVKGNPSIGTSTDLNGKYILDIPDEADVLVFSMVGFESQEIPVKGKSVINVVMKESVNQLDEAVVVAFGTQKKESVIGSITTINPSELKVPSSNLTTALAGKMAGIIAYQRSGEPGQDNAAFFIRGVTTFGTGKKDPLILIDGVEVTTTDLARLQADDVGSFSIMKDATATALYGSRAANGVVLVTTKTGKEGKAKINFRLENSISQATKNVELADPITYMRLQNEAVLTRNPLGVPVYSQSKIDNTLTGTNSTVFPATDWQSELLKNSTINQRANLNVSGGSQVARYYVAGTFNKDNGILKVDNRNNFNNNIDLKSYSLLSNVNVNLSKSTEMIVRLRGNFDDYTGPVGEGTGVYRSIMRTNPVLFPAYYPATDDLQYTQHILFGNDPETTYINPYADLVKGYKEYSRSNMLAQFELKQDLSSLITKGLSVRAMAQTLRNTFFDVSRSYSPYWYNVGFYDKYSDQYSVVNSNPDGGTEYLDYSPGQKNVSSNFYLESAVNYNRSFDKHTFGGLLVYMMRNNITGNGNDLQASLPFRNVGLSGRGTYAYDNRYYLEFNFGLNGSERFAQSERFGFFPSAGAAWSISNEKFFEPLRNTITKLRIRGTYGLTGNDQIGRDEDRFFFLSNVNMNDSGNGAVFGRDNGYSRPGVSISRYDNSMITWETSKKLNLALELSLAQGFDLIAEYFTDKRSNILMARADVPLTLGLQATPYSNLGKASGKGVDISLDYSKSFNNTFWLTGRGNFTYAKSEFEIYEEPEYNEAYLSRVGNPLSQQWGYIAERLFIDDEDVRNSPPQSFGEYMAGDIKYRDVNKDGIVNNLDMVPIGYPTDPEIIYGFGFSTGYKGFDLSAFLQGSARSSFWINTGATAPFVSYKYSSSESLSGQPVNQLLKAYADDHWSEDNRNLYALWPRLSDTFNDNNAQQSTWFMRNGAFLRLKSVEFGYTLPTKLTQRLKVRNLRVYCSGTNLATITGFKLWDIEQAGRGLDYPIQKVYNFGLQLGF
ncbi:MAG TPA: TonB-dependent receptor [Pelobium sp.]|nr:TonB-dependent receptor [Pelobium sp.]